MKTILITVLFPLSLMTSSHSLAGLRSEGRDTTTTENKKDLDVHWRFTARLHTKGIFMYSGRLGTDNPTFDVNFTFDYKKWGLLIFKGIDLRDHTTGYNFSLVTVFRNFKLSDNIIFTPYVGSFLEQTHHFAGEGSDVVCILITSVKLVPHFTFEHMALFGNLVIEPTYLDNVNRFRITYTGKHLDAAVSLWHNNQMFDNTSYVTSGLNVAYSRMKLTKQIFLSAGITALATVHTSDREENPATNKLMITLAAQWIH